MNGTVTITDKNDKQKKIKYEYLFPERFSKDWYTQQFASLGAYSAQALLQCDPQIRGGNLIDTTKIKYHNDTSDFPKTKYYRVWDLAHSAKQTQKDDPDYTSGTLLCYTKIQGLWHLWIKDVERIRGKASERDIFIQAVTQKDGAGVGVAVENSIDAKDAIDAMQTILKGTRIVQAVTIRIDKVARVAYIEPIFEAGNVHILKADWNLDWLKEVQDFPSARHDDQAAIGGFVQSLISSFLYVIY